MELRTCPQCKKSVPPKITFCPYDGAQLGPDTNSRRALPTETTLKPLSPSQEKTLSERTLNTQKSGTPSLPTLDLAGATLNRGAEDPLANLKSKDNLLPGMIVGDYSLIKQIGEGGMGVVWLAQSQTIGKTVAIKFLHQDRITHRNSFQRFVTEAKAVNQINHPNLIDIFSFGTLEDGRPYFVMEYLDGKNLAQRLLQYGALPLATISKVFRQLCEAIQAAHDKGIVHRDLKPDNILLCQSRDKVPQVKILDFGIAKLTGDPDDKGNALTKTGSIVGTLGYMAPEQIERSKDVSNKADLYSLGVILYEVLTGQNPFAKYGNKIADVIVAQMMPIPKPSTVNPARNIPPALDDFILRTIAKTPQQRPESARAFYEELSSIIDGQTDVPPATEPAQRTEPTPPQEINIQSTEKMIQPEPEPAPTKTSWALIAGALLLLGIGAYALTALV
jgi:serine/threonine protein kinase